MLQRLDFPREWITFTDPADDDHEIRADVTWLLSTWGCIFGRGCAGVVAGRASDGCCSHGAFFSDDEDEERVKAFAAKLIPEEWQFAAVGRKRGVTEMDEAHGEERKRTRTVDGACVFLKPTRLQRRCRVLTARARPARGSAPAGDQARCLLAAADRARAGPRGDRG